MHSLFDELDEKVARDPSLTKRTLPRADLSLLLFNARPDLRALWHAAQAEVDAGTASAPLAQAVEALRPLFGERPERPAPKAKR